MAAAVRALVAASVVLALFTACTNDYGSLRFPRGQADAGLDDEPDADDDAGP